MSKLIPGMKVIFIGDDNQVERGTLKSVYDLHNTGIVTLEDGTTVKKVELDKLGIVPEEKKTEESRGSVKLITRDQFLEALNEATTPDQDTGDYDSELITGLTIMIIGQKVANKVFKGKDEIEIDNVSLWYEMKGFIYPSVISKSTGGKISEDGAKSISLECTFVFKKIIDYLFDGPENE